MRAVLDGRYSIDMVDGCRAYQVVYQHVGHHRSTSIVSDGSLTVATRKTHGPGTDLAESDGFTQNLAKKMQGLELGPSGDLVVLTAVIVTCQPQLEIL